MKEDIYIEVLNIRKKWVQNCCGKYIEGGVI